ncbi:putative metal-binding motif-containing protein [Archangium lansingense]|uniref:putative metal-binding motif-containing protein n=1 Tax=Archangium lansingense TaxID=2995310 RepID=UPI003B8090F9
MRHAWIVGSLLLLAACSNKATDSAVALTVKYQGYTPLCLRVTASDAAASERKSDELITQSKLATDEDRTLILAVYREKSWSQQLQVEVASYAMADCTGDAIETRRLAAAVTLPEKGSVPAALELLAQDVDKDGHAASVPGDSAIKGTDCNDSRAAVHPGALAVCDGSDNLNTDFNCDGKLDCNGGGCSSDATCGSGFCVAGICCNSACNEQSQCRSAGVCSTGTCVYTVATGASCDDGSACTTGDTCSGDGVCTGTPKTCNTPPGQCHVAAGTCNSSTGACEYSPRPTTDACDDGSQCTINDRCNGNGTCAGTPKTCNTPPQCRDAAGTCNTTTGACEYPPKNTTETCDDGQPCTEGDKCNGSGTCAGTPKVCNSSPGPCFEGTGTCDTASGVCNYAPKPSSASCSDGQDCTSPDTCNGSGGCVSTFNCPPPSICKEALPACTMDGKCQFQAAAGQAGKACVESGKAGTCLADGTCQPFQFSYSVTGNFDPVAIASNASTPFNDLNISCDTTFDSSGTPSWTNSGCGLTPPAHVVTGDGFVVVPVRDLTVNAPLRVVGARPVILAVYGNATLNNNILAHSSHTEAVMGAGSGVVCSGRAGGSGNVGNADGSGGGGAGLATEGGLGGANDDGSATGGTKGSLLPGGFTPLVGGCQGGSGGNPAGTVAGVGGNGGGALQISVAGTLTLRGVVTVSGAGGKGGGRPPAPATPPSNSAAGGGGGGSGGLLVLEADDLVVDPSARITANGGAGGEGAGSRGSNYYPGSSGANGSTDSAVQALGGHGAADDGGAGGVGGAGSSSPGNGVSGSGSQGGGGGGGGGAAGRILLRGVTSCAAIPAGAIISPPYDKGTGTCP